MNPLHVEANRRTLYCTMSLWGPYDVYLMRLRLAVVLPANLNRDGFVNQADMQLFVACMSEAMEPHNGTSACISADLDQDGDADQEDIGGFQRCLNGLSRVTRTAWTRITTSTTPMARRRCWPW